MSRPILVRDAEARVTELRRKVQPSAEEIADIRSSPHVAALLANAGHGPHDALAADLLVLDPVGDARVAHQVAGVVVRLPPGRLPAQPAVCEQDGRQLGRVDLRLFLLIRLTRVPTSG